MIRFRVALWILGPALAMACAVAAARADDSQPEDVLKSHGLSVKRGGSTYVLAAESEIQLKLNEAQRIFKQLSFALRQRHEFEQAVDQRRRLVPGLLEERIVLKPAAPSRQSTGRDSAQPARRRDSTKSTISSACSKSRRRTHASSKTSTTRCRNNADATSRRFSTSASLSTRPVANTPSWRRTTRSRPPWRP